MKLEQQKAMKLYKHIIDGKAWKELVRERYWNPELHYKKVSHEFRKISICTTTMNRLQDLKRTLPQNIEDNRDYPLVEFLVLDYGSTDGTRAWIRKWFRSEMKSGLVSYCRVDDVDHYSMAKSRNIAFLAASGDIVNNVDADNFTGPGFAARVNELADIQPRRAVFVKGRRMLRGRVGFYREEFVTQLGGYDERLHGYGHDDQDILHRAFGLGFKAMWFGGDFCRLVDDHRKHDTSMMADHDWRYTEKLNKVISHFNLTFGIYKANNGIDWGKALIRKNFGEKMATSGTWPETMKVEE